MKLERVEIGNQQAHPSLRYARRKEQPQRLNVGGSQMID